MRANYFVGMCVGILLVLVLVGCAHAQSYAFVTKWGAPGNGELVQPTDVTVDSFGYIYVTDTDNNRIQKFTNDGTFVTKWGSWGSDDGQFQWPTGISVDISGNVYVADTNNNRIQKFTNDGTFVTKWGSGGTGDGQFIGPRGVAVDSLGNVYVSDGNRIQKFTSDGTFIKKWGSWGPGDGQFQKPIGISVDTSENVYVADTYNMRIQKFTTDGTFITKWDVYGSADGQPYYPYDVTVDSSGIDIYVISVAGTGNLRIQKFANNGAAIKEWSFVSSGLGKNPPLVGPYGIAVDATENVYVADWGNHNIQKFTSDGTFITKWGHPSDGKLIIPHGLAIDSSGNVYVCNWGDHNIQKFTNDGTFIKKWGSYGTADGQFYAPDGVALDSAGNVYVVDSGNCRVQKFSSDGTFITKWDVPGDWCNFNSQMWISGTESTSPSGITVDPSGNVYVTEPWNDLVLKFTNDGTFITSWGSHGTADGQFFAPYGLAADFSGNIYVADGGSVQKFLSDGTFLHRYKDGGYDVALDVSGNVYVESMGWFKKFTNDDRLIAWWGSWGTYDGQSRPNPGSMIALDPSGNVFLTDAGNNRIQVFTKSYTFQTTDNAIQITVDGIARNSPFTVGWTDGTSHTISVPASQDKISGQSQYVFTSWSGMSTSTSPSISITAGESTSGTFNANYATQLLTSDTTTSLISNPNPSVYGQSVTLTASVTVVPPGTGTPTGSVEFLDGSASLGTAPVSNPTISRNNLGAGDHSITAKYISDSSNFQGSTSAAIIQHVNTAPLTIKADDKSKVYGEPLPAFTATYSGFVLGEGTGDLTGTLSLTTPATASSPVGTYPINPAGVSSTNYAITFQAGTLTVNKADTTTVVTSTPNPSIFGESVSFTATVSAVLPGTGTPGGEVTFTGTTPLGSVPLSSGQATFSINSLSAGTNSITATYTGDHNFGASSQTISIIVLTPAQAIDNLKTTVISLNLKNQQGYIAKLDAALNSLAKGDTNAAINQLNAFINLVNAQRGKTLTDADADNLIKLAQEIISNI